jgi:hypothetical protein
VEINVYTHVSVPTVLTDQWALLCLYVFSGQKGGCQEDCRKQCDGSIFRAKLWVSVSRNGQSLKFSARRIPALVQMDIWMVECNRS